MSRVVPLVGRGELPPLLAAEGRPRGGVVVPLEELALGAVVDDLGAQLGGRVLS